MNNVGEVRKRMEEFFEPDLIFKRISAKTYKISVQTQKGQLFFAVMNVGGNIELGYLSNYGWVVSTEGEEHEKLYELALKAGCTIERIDEVSA